MDLDRFFYLLKLGDWLALTVCVVVGYLTGLYVPAGWWSISTSMLVSYHLFLAWLLLTAKYEMQTIRSLGYVASIHLACLVVIVSLGSGRIFIPRFDVVCGGVAVLAFFERSWLFQPAMAVIPEAEEPVESSAEEYKEWLDHLARQGRGAPEFDGSRPGFEASRKQEFEQWLRERRSSNTG